MSTLFVAIALPDAIHAGIAALLPEASPDVRPCHPADLHLTLHYIGRADIETYRRVLTTVELPAMELSLTTVGSFKRHNGSRVLWLGVAPNPSLTELQQCSGQAMAVAGFTPDPRPYAPHISLARCSPGFSHNHMKRFMAQTWHGDRSFRVEAFHIVSSRPTPSGPRYQIEATFPLRGC